MNPLITIITPTIGRESIFKLIDSIDYQDTNKMVRHLIITDDGTKFKDDIKPENSKHRNIINIPGNLGKPYGTNLRAIALMTVDTPWVGFADDDVWWDSSHIEIIEDIIKRPNVEWGAVRRTVHNPLTNNVIGYDDFESVGPSEDRKVPYEMFDGNCMFFKKEHGFNAAHLYRNTDQYNDDRLMYSYLKSSNISYVFSNEHTVNQVCPVNLIGMFEKHCTKFD